MKRIVVLLIIGVFGLGIINAQGAVSSNDARLIAKATDILVRENVIRSKLVSGFQTSLPTEQGWAISIIMQKAKGPADTFATIAETGSYAGLLALYVLDRAKFHAVLDSFRGAEKVIVVTGDQIEEMSSEEFVRAFLPQRGKVTFERLQFVEIPDLIDTVRGEPHGG